MNTNDVGDSQTRDPENAEPAHDTDSAPDLHHPHDKLFAATFSVEENTAALLREKLPTDLATAIDWNSLRHEDGSFVDPAFRRRHADLLFSARINDRETLLYVLFEHQSTRHPRLALRLLQYMLSIWFKIEDKYPWPRPLPPILPVVLSHNATPWDLPGRFAELIDIPTDLAESLRPYVPDFVFRHLQLADMAYESIPGTKSGVFVLRVMKAQRLGELLGSPVWDEDLIVEIPPRLLEMVLRYILGNDVDKSGFEARLNQIENPEIRNKAMTLAQVYHQEGIEKGRQEGRQEGLLASRRQDVLEALELRFAHVPVGLREAIESLSDPEQLRGLHRAAILSATLEEFTASL